MFGCPDAGDRLEPKAGRPKGCPLCVVHALHQLADGEDPRPIPVRSRLFPRGRISCGRKRPGVRAALPHATLPAGVTIAGLVGVAAPPAGFPRVAVA